MIYLIPGLKMIFEFIQNNIFKMNWLYNLTGKVLKLIPFDLNMRLSGNPFFHL